MVKHITKIRPYRVFKKDGLHFVKINKKKVYIRHATKNKLRNGDKQIVSVVVNNLLAQRKSRQRKRKNKSVLAIESTSKTANQLPGGQINGRIDPTKIPDTAGIQAPTVDPIYANANRRSQPPQIEGAPPSNASSNEMTIKHDYTGMSSALYNAYMYGKSERELGNQILGIHTRDDQGLDMSNPDDVSHMSNPPDLLDLTHIPDQSSPPDGASGASITRGEQEFDLLIQEATDAEQQKRKAEIDAETEANRSILEKQQLEAEELQRQFDEQTLQYRQAEEEQKRKLDARAEQAEKPQEEEAIKAGTAGASGATTRSTEIGTELTKTNIQLYLIRSNRINQQQFSARD